MGPSGRSRPAQIADLRPTPNPSHLMPDLGVGLSVRLLVFLGSWGQQGEQGGRGQITIGRAERSPIGRPPAGKAGWVSAACRQLLCCGGLGGPRKAGRPLKQPNPSGHRPAPANRSPLFSCFCLLPAACYSDWERMEEPGGGLSLDPSLSLPLKQRGTLRQQAGGKLVRRWPP
jgi:hypothetical protein